VGEVFFKKTKSFIKIKFHYGYSMQIQAYMLFFDITYASLENVKMHLEKGVTLESDYGMTNGNEKQQDPLHEII